MAASLVRRFLVENKFISRASCNVFANYQMTRRSHILSKVTEEEKVVMVDNGDTIVCWHPENKFPYECSLPLPSSDKASSVSDVLKVTEEEYKEVFTFVKPQFQREHLMRVTATTKHRWFPKNRSRERRQEPDREFL